MYKILVNRRLKLMRQIIRGNDQTSRYDYATYTYMLSTIQKVCEKGGDRNIQMEREGEKEREKERESENINKYVFSKYKVCQHQKQPTNIVIANPKSKKRKSH